MIFNQLKVTYQGVEKTFIFTSGVNLINSKKNSVGKSTLLRLLFFAMGYAVPGTKGIAFKKVACELLIKTPNGKYTLSRLGNLLELTKDDKKSLFLLPSESDELHAVLFGSNNLSVIENILGSIYLDQEKGWTLLNRGVVIGRIPFNITKLVGGLADRNIDDLELELYSTNQELDKYKAMRDIYHYQTTIKEFSNDFSNNDYLDDIERDINILNIEKNALINQIKNIEQSKIDNESFVKYVENMRILVTDGKVEIPVTKESIVNYDENQDIMNTRISILELRKKKIEKQIKENKRKLEQENSLISIQSQIEKFDSQIHGITIDQISLDKIIRQLETNVRKVKKDIKHKVTNNNEVVDDIYYSINKYSNELGVASYIDIKKDYIFTKELSSLSGAVLHKIVFIFKLAYIIEIEKFLEYKLPIVLDSPSGREVDQENIKDIMKILARDFKDNQIIIASIFDNYGFKKTNKIVLEKGIFR